MNGYFVEIDNSGVYLCYEDGDVCAEFYDNLALGVDAAKLAQRVCDFLNGVRSE